MTIKLHICNKFKYRLINKLNTSLYGRSIFVQIYIYISVVKLTEYANNSLEWLGGVSQEVHTISIYTIKLHYQQ